MYKKSDTGCYQIVRAMVEMTKSTKSNRTMKMKRTL